MQLLLEIALTHIRDRSRQTVVSIAGVTLGVGFAIAMAALMQGSQDEFVGTLIDAMPHVQITDERRTAPIQPSQRAFDAVHLHGLRPEDDVRGILNPTAAVARLSAWVPGSLSAGLTLQGLARYGGAERSVQVMGVEPRQAMSVSSIDDDMVEGRFEELDTAGFAAVIGDRLARRLSIEINDSLRLTTATGVARQFKVVGLFHTGIIASDEGLVYVRLKSAQVLAARQNAINDIRIRIDDPNTAPVVAARAQEMLGYKSVSWQEANEDLLEAFVIRNVIMYTVVAAILVVAGFGIFNIVATITHEKSRDIAILKSLGFRESDIRRIFLAEGAFMGITGSVFGSALGYALSWVMSGIEFNLEQQTEVTHLPITLNWVHYLIASAIAIGTSAVAGYLPARKASQGNPVDIIRGAT